MKRVRLIKCVCKSSGNLIFVYERVNFLFVFLNKLVLYGGRYGKKLLFLNIIEKNFLFKNILSIYIIY